MRVYAISFKRCTNKNLLYYDKICKDIKKCKELEKECIKIALNALGQMGRQARKVK